MPYLKSIGDFADLNIDEFVDDTAIRKAFAERGQDYDAALNSTTNPSAISGQDPVCNVAVTDPKLASEVWLDGEDATQPAANPGCLLRAVREANAGGEQVRAAYVPDTEIGTRWFADKSVWVQDGRNYLPFGTPAGAQRYIAGTPRRDGRRLRSRRWWVRCDRAARGADRRRTRRRRPDRHRPRQARTGAAAGPPWPVRIASVAAASRCGRC